MNIAAQFCQRVRDDAELLELERMIAQCADQLAHGRHVSGIVSDCSYWLEAERQMLDGDRAPVRVPTPAEDALAHR